MQKFSLTVQNIIRDHISDRFSIIVHRWESSDTHLVSIFSTFPAENACDYENEFLPVPRKGTNILSDRTDIFLVSTAMLSRTWHKSLEITVKLICLYRGTAQACLGFHIHKYNLAKRNLVAESNVIVSLVDIFITRSGFQFPAAKLCRLTRLEAQQANTTHGSSTYHVLKIYVKLKKFFLQMDDLEVTDLLPD